MNWLEALILGIIQGLTEFLPVSSSGHLEIGKVILGVEAERSLIFTVLVHGATVMSTIVIFWRDILLLIRGLFSFRWNEETKFIFKIIISMIPVAIVGLFFKEEVELFFTGNLILVGSMLLLTATLLLFTRFKKSNERSIGFLDSFVIGLAQAVAVIPGISRSGSTISAGLMLGNKRAEVAKFSFLMVLIPIIGANLKDLLDGEFVSEGSIGVIPLIVLKTAFAIQDNSYDLISQSDLITTDEIIKSAPKISKADCRINWNSKSVTIYNLIRGLNPVPAAFTVLSGPNNEEIQLKIFKASYKMLTHDHKPGEIFITSEKQIATFTSDGTLTIEELQMAGKKRLQVKDFLNGFPITPKWKMH
jgi:undecaprenyl-diphosphatase